MDDEDATRPSANDQLRDQIFQMRLHIEQLRRGSNIDLLKKAEDKLRIIQQAQRTTDAQQFKRRGK